MFRPLTTALALLVLVTVATPAVAQTAFGDTLSSFSAGQLTGDTTLMGLEYVDGHYWLTGFNPPYYDHRLYRITPDGGEVVSSTSLATGYHAYYDLAHDGEYLYVTDRDHLAQIDPASGQLTGVEIPTDFGVRLVQGVAHDPATDHFWVIPQRNGQLQVIHEVDRQGTVLATYPNLDTDYTTALTWDTWSPGGPFLWTFSREEIGYQSRVVMRQFSPTIGAFTGVEIEVVNRSELQLDGPRGLVMTDQLVPGTVTMSAVQAGALVPGDGLDWVVVYDADLGDEAPGVAIDVSPGFIETEVHQDDVVQVSVTVANNGALPLSWHAYVENPDAVPGGGAGELGDLLGTIDVVAAGDPDFSANGLTVARGDLWVTGTIGFNQVRLYRIDRDGQLVAEYALGGLNSVPWRSIASDGDFLYGTDTYFISVWSIDEQQVVGYIDTGSISQQAMAYDPNNQHFYLGGGTGAIEVIDRQGDTVRLVVTPYSIAGLAWDDVSPGGPFLWAWVDRGDDEVERCEAVQLDPVTGLATGVSFRGQDQGTAIEAPRAVAITRDFTTDKLALLGLQGSYDGQDDAAFVAAYDLDVNLPPAWIDLSGPTLGTIASLAADTLTVAIHGAMADTTTAAVIKIGSNDLAQPLVEVPVTVAMLERLIPLAAAGVPASLLVVQQNHPNPFNPSTTIAFELREAAEVTLEIIDARGRRVSTQTRAFGQAGRHSFVWEGTDQAGRRVASGVYLYTLSAGDVEATRKMLLTK